MKKILAGCITAAMLAAAVPATARTNYSVSFTPAGMSMNVNNYSPWVVAPYAPVYYQPAYYRPVRVVPAAPPRPKKIKVKHYAPVQYYAPAPVRHDNGHKSKHDNHGPRHDNGKHKGHHKHH